MYLINAIRSRSPGEVLWWAESNAFLTSDGVSDAYFFSAIRTEKNMRFPALLL